MAARAPVDAGVHLLQCGLTRLQSTSSTFLAAPRDGRSRRAEGRRARERRRPAWAEVGAPSHLRETQEEQSLVTENMGAGVWPLLASHACTKLGSKAWEFATPVRQPT
jgi:hypothetical protein